MSPTDNAHLAERLADVERRVASIEATVALSTSSVRQDPGPHGTAPTPAASATSAPAALPSDFYALDGVKQSMPEGGVVYAGTAPTAAGPVEWQIGLPYEHLMDTDWSTVAPALAALGHPVRIRLVQAILAGATTIHELGALEEIGTTGQLYHHLGQLTAAGWTRAEGRGRYAIPADRVVPLLAIVAAAGRL